MAPILGDIIRLSCVFTDSVGGQQVNVFHLQINTVGSGGPTGFMEDVQDWVNGLYTQIQGEISNNVTGTRLEFVNITTPAVYGPVMFSPSFTGGASTTPLPTGVTMLVIGRTGVSRVIARKYLPKMAEAAYDGVHWTSGAQADGLDFANGAWSGSGVGSNGWAFTSGVYQASGGAFYEVEDVAVEPIPAYQRRRKEGRGS